MNVFVFYEGVEVYYCHGARVPRTEAFLLLASYFVRFDVVRGQYGEARCPKFV